MTPSADPTPLHIIMESTGNGDGISAGWVALIAAGVSGIVAIATTWLNLWHSSKRHEAELAERKADRLFDARKEVASRCLRTIQQYKANKSIDDFEGRRKALRELHATIQEDIGELSLLFSPQVSSIANEIKESSALTVMKLSSFLDIYLKAQLQAEANKTAENSKRLSNVSERYIDFLVDSDKSMQNHFDLFTESLTKELGTYQEPETIEEA